MPRVTWAISKAPPQKAIEQWFPMEVKVGLPLALLGLVMVLHPPEHRLGIRASVRLTDGSGLAFAPSPRHRFRAFRMWSLPKCPLRYRFGWKTAVSMVRTSASSAWSLKALQTSSSTRPKGAAEAGVNLDLQPWPLSELTADDLPPRVGRKLLKSIKVKGEKQVLVKDVAKLGQAWTGPVGRQEIPLPKWPEDLANPPVGLPKLPKLPGP